MNYIGEVLVYPVCNEPRAEVCISFAHICGSVGVQGGVVCFIRPTCPVRPLQLVTHHFSSRARFAVAKESKKSNKHTAVFDTPTLVNVVVSVRVEVRYA